MRRVLSFGPLVDPSEIGDIPDASVAANAFQIGLLRGLRAAGVQRVSAITAFPIKTLPPRTVVVRGRRWHLGSGVDVVAPGFVNLPPIKPLWVHARLVRAGLAAAQGVDAVYAYNPLPGWASAGLSVARRLGVPFVCIAADFGPEVRFRSIFRRVEQGWSTRIARNSDGLIVLSGHTARDLGTERPWLKIEGGVADDWARVPDVDVVAGRIVYAGTPTAAGGTRLLLDAFARCDRPDARLIFAGRGGLEEEIRSAAAADARIRAAGFLPRSELQRLLASATVLVNPRLSSERENRYNFPSKMFDYLPSGRPVITTMAGDLDPIYKTIAIPLMDETPDGLASLLQDVLGRSAGALDAVGGAGRDFALSKRRWEGQAAEVYRFTEGLRGRA